MHTRASEATIAGEAGNRAISAGAASGTNEVLRKECQPTEFFTQETQDKQDIQEAQDPQAAQERQEIKEIHVLHDRKALTEKDSVDEDAEIEIEQAIASSRLPSVDSFMSHGFLLARRIRGIELRHQFRCGPMLLRSIFDRWEEQNQQYLTDGSGLLFGVPCNDVQSSLSARLFEVCVRNRPSEEHPYPCPIAASAGATASQTVQRLTKVGRRRDLFPRF